ncbi:MAG: OmpH family outer membrane protein [Bacteroidales bacterium]|nr:OmpH family outer membrane protein [Bacteroidales bacterium]
MKRTLSILAILMFVAIGFNLNAQTSYKFGHIDSRKLMQALPESEQAQKALEAEGKSVQDQMEVMEVELNNKYNDYLTNEKLPVGDAKKWSAIVKADKEKELNSLQQRIQEFQQNAQNQLNAKREELFKPILEKVDKAIKEVAKENKFTYVFDVSTFLYYSEESIDITAMVKTKLALK